MKKNNDSLHEIIDELPLEVQIQTKLSMAVAKRLESLIKEKGLNKKQFAESLGRHPSEVTKWLSGEHNFTIATLAMFSAYFNESIIEVKN